MQKKLLIGAIFTILSIGIFPTHAASPSEDAKAPVCTEQTEACSSKAETCGQTELTGDWVNSIEKNSVQESELARKMKQLEKAKNAKENDGYGFAITIIAMCIVIAALAVLSILFNIFGKISSSLQKSRKRKAHGVSEHDAEEHHDELDSGEVIAAISMALAEHLGHGHDIENTILTLRRMRKAYSPWNSKIYNMRHVEEPHKVIPPSIKRK